MQIRRNEISQFCIWRIFVGIQISAHKRLVQRAFFLTPLWMTKSTKQNICSNYRLMRGCCPACTVYARWISRCTSKRDYTMCPPRVRKNTPNRLQIRNLQKNTGAKDMQLKNWIAQLSFGSWRGLARSDGSVAVGTQTKHGTKHINEQAEVGRERRQLPLNKMKLPKRYWKLEWAWAYGQCREEKSKQATTWPNI